jgi:aquaporin Z
MEEMNTNDSVKKCMAELFGTMVLVLFGCGTAVLAGAQVGQLGIALAFGLAIVAMAYSIGPVSGCHINPAVSIAMFFAGRMGFKDMAQYIIAQCIGACIGAAFVMLIAQGKADYTVAAKGLGQNGFGEGYLGGYTLQTAIIFEFLATLIFTKVILATTADNSVGPIAGLAIGLTLAVIHIMGIDITGVSVNPARSLGPAVYVGGHAMSQLWVFIVVPLAAGITAGVTSKSKVCFCNREAAAA